MASPRGEIGPAGPAAIEHPVAHVAGRGLKARGADHPLNRNGKLPFFVTAVHGGHLISNVHRDGVGHGRRHRGWARCGLCVQHVRAVEHQIPGVLSGHPVGFETVMLLKQLNRRHGLVHVVTADRAVEKAQLRQARLYLLDLLALGAAPQLPAVLVLALAVGGAFAVANHDDVVDIAHVRFRVRGGGRFLAFFPGAAAEKHALGFHIGLARRV